MRFLSVVPRLRLRRVPVPVFVSAVFLTIFLVAILFHNLFRDPPPMVGGHRLTPPPTYNRVIQAENALQQHSLSQTLPGGKNGRYVKFSNQGKGIGWNNILTEILLCNHLAWRAKRAYVFQDFIWNPKHYPWRIPPWPWPRTPLSALVGGPLVGGSWPEGDDAPLSVSERYFDAFCPPEDTEVFDTDVAKAPIQAADAKYVMEHWLRLLNESPKRCVNIGVNVSEIDGYPQTFDLWTVSTSQILTIWPEFRDSPVSQLLKPSRLVTTAVERNEPLLFSSTGYSLSNRYDNMVAVHLRRGDYLNACQGFSNWSSTFYGWNNLPELPDPFVPPPGGGAGYNTPANEALYVSRCYPTEDQIMAKIMDVKLDWETSVKGRPQLHSLYIMTNAEEAWLHSLILLSLREGWKTVVSSADLLLDDEQTGIGMAVDMDIARRAGVFIGNGWSSLTSNVVHRRLVDKHNASSIRFW